MNLEELLEALDILFSNCETGFDVDRYELCKLLEKYKNVRKEWSKYAFRDDLRYTRNLVKKGRCYEVILMRWGPGHASSIHSHSGSHCAMKVLQGEIKETLYEVPKSKGPMQPTQVTVVHEDEIAYISDDIGLHRIENSSHFSDSVSLHVYIPAFDHTNRFDDVTGKHKKVRLVFTSVEGKKSIISPS